MAVEDGGISRRDEAGDSDHRPDSMPVRRFTSLGHFCMWMVHLLMEGSSMIWPNSNWAAKMEWPPMTHRKSSSILPLSLTCANSSAVCGPEVGGSSTVKPCLGLMALKYVSNILTNMLTAARRCRLDRQKKWSEAKTTRGFSLRLIFPDFYTVKSCGVLCLHFAGVLISAFTFPYF